MKKSNKRTFRMVKLILMMVILFLLSGVGVMAVTTKTKTVKISLSNGYEMTVLTSKTKVLDILKENNILILDNEKVSPKEDEELTEGVSIVITNKSEQEIEVAKISESGVETTLDSLLEAYDTIVEKIEVVEEEIPFETIKKDVSNGASSTKNKVLQQGENGIKEITYRVKYQNNTEIERTKISEKVTKEPVDKIVQINSAVVTSRASDTTRTSTASNISGTSVGIYKVTAYCPCSICSGKWSDGITACGRTAQAGHTIATDAKFAFGTKLKINGQIYTVEDRGGAIKGNRIDTHAEALRWGVRYLPVEVVE